VTRALISTFLIVPLFCVTAIFNTYGQFDQWPIKNATPGTRVVFRPQDYIGDELNFGNIYISSLSDGQDSIISPCTGIVDGFYYSYYETIKNTRYFGNNYKQGIQPEAFDSAYRNAVGAKFKLNPAYISVTIVIKNKMGTSYTISGIRPGRFYKTGSPIEKGDFIGTVGYTYSKIPYPCISISRSKSNKLIDPMTRFGLYSTFIPSESSSIDYRSHKFSELALHEDFQIFKNTLSEGHPGLYDYTTEDRLDSLFQSVLQQLNHQMTVLDFCQLLVPIIHEIKDSHTALIPRKNSLTTAPVSSMSIGYDHDQLIVYATSPDQTRFLGKVVDSINDQPAEDIITKLKGLVYGQDGYIQTVEKRKLMFEFWKYYDQLNPISNKEELTLKFADKSTCSLTFSSGNISQTQPLLKPAMHQRLSTKRLSDTIAYIQLGTFQLSDTELDSIGTFIKEISDNKENYTTVIFDLRDNRGGIPEAVYKVYAYIATRPFKPFLSQKVNKTGRYELFKHSLNYSYHHTRLFTDYEEKEGETGYFFPSAAIQEVLPDSTAHFNKKVVVLTNEYTFSAATLFAGLVRKHKRGIIIGRETGSSYHQLNATKSAQILLPNTNLILYLPLIKTVYDTATDKQSFGRGVCPDYTIDISFDHFISSEDLFLNSCLRYLEKRK
jgi:hypothetical protein